MEREDSHEHAKSNCDPIKEGQIFLAAMKKYESERLSKMKNVAIKKDKIPKIVNRPAAPSVTTSSFNLNY
jgi:hypothetical protein